MKTLCCLCLLLFSCVANSQIDRRVNLDSSKNKVTLLSDVTAFGRADGSLVKKQIGSAGGTIASDDGRIQLVFPAGALSANTFISIQATTNPAPNGVGKAYQFEPSGIQFKKPVEINFKYTEEEGETCPPDWMSLGIQDEKGKWTFIDYEEFDSVSKTLKGYLHHFTGASNIYDIELEPDKNRVAVNGRILIDVSDISVISLTENTPSGHGLALINPNDPILWYVNQVQNGNSQTGTISSSSGPIAKNKITVAEYDAPGIMPQPNPVAIWAEIYRKTRKGKKLRRRLRTYIEVYDAYRIEVSQVSEGRGGMEGKIIDSASFTVYVYPDAFLVYDIKNYPPIVLKEGRRPPFKEKIIVQDALGTVHITEGITNSRLSKSNPPVVYFEFKPLDILMCKVQYTARGTSSGEPQPLFTTSIPQEIHFIANGIEQTYHLGPENYRYSLVVKPLGR